MRYHDPSNHQNQSNSRRIHAALALSILIVLLISILALFLPLGSSSSKLGYLIDQKITNKIKSLTEAKRDPQTKPATPYLDGAKIIQASPGSKVINQTNTKTVQNVTNVSLDTLTQLSCASDQSIIFNGSLWLCYSPNKAVVDNDRQQLQLDQSNRLLLTNSSSIDLSKYLDNTDSQDISLIANKLSIQNGSTLDLSTYLDNTDVLGSLSCLSGQVAKWDGGEWICAADLEPDSQTLSWDPVARKLSLTNGGAVTISDNDTTYSSGSGLSLVGNQFKIDPNNLSAVSSVANSDVIILGTSSGPQKITYNDLFGNVLGALNYRGTWDSSTNNPNLSSYCDANTKGHYYVVSVPGNTNLNGFTNWRNNDWAICDGVGWEKIESTNQVSSVFGRNGAVIAQDGDYNASQIDFTPSGTLSSTSVQTAINELRDETLSLNLPSGQIYIGNNSNRATAVTLGGDISLDNSGVSTITSGSVNSAKIADGSLIFADWASSGCTSGQIPKFNGSAWACAADKDSISSLSCSTNQVLWWDSALSKWQCSQLNTYNIADGTIDLADMAANSVNSSKITDLSITAADIANNTITSGKILDGTITFADIASNGCVSGQIMKYNGSAWACAADSGGIVYSAGAGITIDGSNVISSTLGTDITSAEIVDGTIVSSDILDGAITSGKILDGTVLSSDIADGTITFADWSSNGCVSGDVPRYNGSAWACGQITGSLGAWSANSNIAIGATTTPPSKATTKVADYIKSRNLQGKEYEVEFKYAHTNTAGTSNGNGDYLFSLPGGLTFDSTQHPFYTGTSTTDGQVSAFAIPNSIINVAADGINATALILPYDATRFRIQIFKGDGEFSRVGSGSYQMSYTNLTLTGDFRLFTP